MEWLGDALLDLIVAGELYKRFPRDDEVSLSLRKQLIVRNDVLSIASRRLDLPTLMLHSRERIACDWRGGAKVGEAQGRNIWAPRSLFEWHRPRRALAGTQNSTGRPDNGTISTRG